MRRITAVGVVFLLTLAGNDAIQPERLSLAAHRAVAERGDEVILLQLPHGESRGIAGSDNTEMFPSRVWLVESSPDSH